jgi:histidine triad (HIT) family protein
MIEDKNENCIFCDILAGKADAYRIYEDDLSLCILDINPYTKGHCLVISKRHVPWWHDLTGEETESLFEVARIVANKMMKILKPDFVFLYARGRRIPHTHIFLIPTYSGDVLDRFFNALEKFQESPRDLVKLTDKTIMEETAHQLREAE